MFSWAFSQQAIWLYLRFSNRGLEAILPLSCSDKPLISL
jgi:hypothetical protein